MVKKSLFAAVLVVMFLAGVSYAQESTDQNAVSSQGQQSGEEHGHHTPSQAAIDACSGKSESDDCSFTTPRGKDVTGTCSKIKDGQTMFCKRARKTSS